MPVSLSDLLPTPEGYATPEQVKAAQAYAALLTKKSTETRPIYNKAWGGLNMMAQALGGAFTDSMAAKAEKAALRQGATDSLIDVPGGAPEAPNAGYSSASPVAPLPGAGAPRANYMKGAPSAELSYAETPGGVRAQVNKEAAPAFTGFLSDLEAAGAPLKDVGSYNSRKIAGTNMWSQHAHGNAVDINQTGRNQVSPEFRAWAAANPDKLGEIERKHNMVSGANFKSGGPDFGHWEWGGPQAGGKALAFNGEPTNIPSPNSPEAVVNALAPSGLGGATPPLPKSTPVGDSGTPPTGIFTGRPQISRQQMHSILSNPWVTQENKNAYQQMYLQQNNPVQMEGTGGTWVMGKDQKPYFIPKLIEKTIKAPGGAEVPAFYGMNPKTGVMEMRDAQGPEPKAPTTTAPLDVPNLQYAAPGDAGKGMLNPTGLPPEILTGRSASAGAGTPANSIPNMPDFEGEKPLPIEQTPPDLEKSGMLNFAPPDAAGAIDQVLTPKAGTIGKTAQAGGGSTQRTLDALTQQGIDYETRKHAADKEMESYQKKIDTLTDVGQRAQGAKSSLQMAKELVKNPNFYSGIGADQVVDWKRIKSKLFENEPNAAAANEAFEKIISGQILNDMKVNLQGLGQVRVAEIDLLSKAAANRYLSPAANQLVLDLMIKAHDRAETIGKIATGYQAGARWDKDGKVVRGADGNPVISDKPPRMGEVNAMINRYLDNKPILTKDEQKQLSDIIASPKEYGMPAKPEKKNKFATERPEPKAKPRNPPGPPPPAATAPAGYE